MPMTPVPKVTLTPVAYFPENYFLENLAVRADGSVLITTVLQKELWLVPGPEPTAEVGPVLVHTFDYLVTGIVETEPDVFVVCVTDGYATHQSYLARLDLGGWAPGDPVSPQTICTFDDRVRSLNGACLLGPGTLAIADCFAGLIWRVDLADDGHAATARVWLTDDTMAFDPDSGVAPPPQPGVNGVRYGASTGYLYYTSTAQQVFMRVPVDPATLDPAGHPEFVASIDSTDDFCLDEDAGFAYVTRHRGNTLDRVPLEPRHGSEVRRIAGDPFDEILVGPSSAFWGRGPGDPGRVAYVTTDGGRTAPPADGIIRRAALVRLELHPSAGSEGEK
jgi:sugar lactone lactonase YvrE